MSSTRALDALAVRKAAVQARIAARRTQCGIAAAQLAGPAALVDRGVALWQSIPGKAKWAAVPVGLFAARVIGKRLGGPAALLRYAPMVMGVAKSVMEMRGRKTG